MMDNCGKMNKQLDALAKIFFASAILYPAPSHSATAPPRSANYEYHGKVSVGGYAAKEELHSEPQSGTSNDYATLSTRLFYQAENKSHVVWTADLRDKNDFFNKLDKERLQLTNSNTLQAREISARRDNNQQGLLYEAGRYAVPDAGAVYNDGASLGWRLNPTWSTEGFYGLNPKRPDKSYLEYDPDSKNYGIVLRYIPKSENWSRRKMSNTSFVEQADTVGVSRKYLYNQSVFQWGRDSLVSSMIYLDFIPRTYVQTALINYNQEWKNSIQTHATLTAMDVIEYRRQQDVREILTPSPYREGKIKALLLTNPTHRWSISTLYGQREYDKKERQAWIAELQMPRYLSKNMDFLFRASTKKEFTKVGNSMELGLGYYTDDFELDLLANKGREKQTDGSYLNPTIVDGNLGLQISKMFFGAGGIQYAHDENVNIVSVYFKLTYRFGNKELPPLRDGAPPRGRL